MRRIGCLVAIAIALPALGSDEPVARRRRPLPHEYGRVVMNGPSEAARMPGVVFDHWVHRARYTCRLCHVDVGFAMKAGATGVRAADNQKGLYCGACHDGKTVSDGRKVFEACGKPAAAPEVRPACLRCHSSGKGVKPEHDFATFARGMPRERFGNGIDWERAELERKITPVDFLEGVSIRRSPISAQKDFALSPKLEGMPEIVFSHAKHTVWNGCEVCHPDIFAVRKGATRTTMVAIFEGGHCGTCHASVAFPLLDCQRCHVKPVQ